MDLPSWALAMGRDVHSFIRECPTWARTDEQYGRIADFVLDVGHHLKDNLEPAIEMLKNCEEGYLFLGHRDGVGWRMQTSTTIRDPRDRYELCVMVKGGKHWNHDALRDVLYVMLANVLTLYDSADDDCEGRR